MAALYNPHKLLIRQIEAISPLSAHARDVLSSLPIHEKEISEHRDIMREGENPGECCLVLAGLACRYKIVVRGRRQILSLHYAGDLLDLDNLVLTRADHSSAALTAALVGFIPHHAIRRAAAECRDLADAFARQTLVDSAIFREWIANVGRRLAIERVSHLICEVFTRMRSLGLANEDSFNFPMTQTEIGDATGLSNVHVNRTLQTLRRDAILRIEGRFHKIMDWAKLRDRADFDPAYLHLRAA